MCKVDKLYEWCYNCPLEFKSQLPFDVLLRLSIIICRNFWSENLGKGPADAFIGRHCIQSAIAFNLPLTKIRQYQSWYGHCIVPPNSHGYPPYIDNGQCQHYHRTFVCVDTIDRTGCNNTVRTMKGTRELHCVQNTGIPGALNVHRSSHTCRCVCYIINIIVLQCTNEE